MVAIGTQFALKPLILTNGVPVSLEDKFANDVIGWSKTDLPIGATEQLERISAETLRYDSYFYRSYSKGTIQFSIFVAYWSRGKHPPQMVAQHTPDRCWTMNGATCMEARNHVLFRIGKSDLVPTQWRKFKMPDGSLTYVLFWHRVGTRFFDYGDHMADMLDPFTFWKEEVNFLAGGKAEQYFFRLTSNVAPEELQNDQGFISATRGLLALGLAGTGQNE